MLSKLATTWLRVKPPLSCSLSVCRCLIEMTLERTVEHIWGGRENTAGCHGIAYPIFCWFLFGRRKKEIDVRFKLWTSRTSFLWRLLKKKVTAASRSFSLQLQNSKPQQTSLSRHLIWLLSACSLGLSVWLSLNKLLKQKQLSFDLLLSAKIHALVRLTGGQTHLLQDRINTPSHVCAIFFGCLQWKAIKTTSACFFYHPGGTLSAYKVCF